MKLYRGMRKRLAKKILGQYWYKLLYGATLKPGELVSACRGFNEKILEIEPEWEQVTTLNGRMVKGWVVRDFYIKTDGNGCSLIHCCTYPLKSRQEIIEHFNWYKTPEGQKWLDEQAKNGYDFATRTPLKEFFLEGESVFNEDGGLE